MQLLLRHLNAIALIILARVAASLRLIGLALELSVAAVFAVGWYAATTIVQVVGATSAVVTAALTAFDAHDLAILILLQHERSQDGLLLAIILVHHFALLVHE